MLAPMIVLLSLKLICMYLPNLLLLSFRVVFAFPIAYNKPFTSKCY